MEAVRGMVQIFSGIAHLTAKYRWEDKLFTTLCIVLLLNAALSCQSLRM